MNKRGLRTLLDKIFPTADSREGTNEFVERALEALRSARNHRALDMGSVRRVPSRLELRVSAERLDELIGMQAIRDLEYFFTDELMKDLAVEGMRTFGDFAVRVTIAVDAVLAAREIYAAVLAPESAPREAGSVLEVDVEDSTRALGQESPPTLASVARPVVHRASWRLALTGPGGTRHQETLDGDRWILGRAGSSGRPLPSGYRKLDLDLRETVSREQVRVEIGRDALTIERIGKAVVSVSNDDKLREGETRAVEFGVPFAIEDYEITITRQS